MTRTNRTPTLAAAVAVLCILGCASPDPISRPGDTLPSDVPDSGQDGTDPGRDGTVPDDGPGKDPGKDAPPPTEVVEDGTEDPGEDGVQPVDAPGDGTSDTPADAPKDVPLGPDATGTPIVRPCQATLTFHGNATSIHVPGDWNAWSPTAHPMTGPDGNGTWSVTLDLADVLPGSHGYKILVDGATWMVDPANPLTLWDPTYTYENSKLRVPDCTLPALELVSASTDWATRSATVEVQAYTGTGSEPLLPASVQAWSLGERVDPGFDPETQRFTVRLSGLAAGKHTVTFRAATSKGEADPLFVPLWLEETPFAWQDAVLYFAMTDRFANGDATNDAPAPCVPAEQASKNTNWEGGDWRGLKGKIEDGYFDRLGVTAIWISAPNDNPDLCFGGDLASATYTAYHAYFPLALDQPENHFGTMDDLRAMVAAAHAHGIRILMDLDANHVHEDSDLWKAHKDWFNQGRLICGADDNWNQHPIDCWFQSYLPDLDYRNDDAVEAVTDSAIEWVRQADLDGFRVDAVKHMIHGFGYHLRDKVRRHLEASGVPFWLVGETFVGDWGNGTGANEATVKAYLSDRELTGQFDFPLYWEVLTALARRETAPSRMATVAAATHAYWQQAFPGAVMSNFLGNHDVPRFVSHAAGAIADKWGNGSKEQGWTSPPGLPSDPEPFRRLQQAFAFLMTIPGVPLIYYGDEIGMPGAGDPDNRRMMAFDGLTADQVAVRDALGKMAAFRAAHPATRRGTLVQVTSDDDGLVYGVHGGGDAVIGVINRGPARTMSFGVSSVPGIPADGDLTDGLTGAKATVTGGQVSIPVGAQGVVLLAR